MRQSSSFIHLQFDLVDLQFLHKVLQFTWRHGRHLAARRAQAILRAAAQDQLNPAF